MPSYSPASTTFTLANATLAADLVPGLAVPAAGPDRLALCDIHVAHGNIASITAAGATAINNAEHIDLKRGLVLPRFVDIHTHIDKGQILPRTPSANGTHDGARASVGADRTAYWSRADVGRRMDFNLRCAFAHGTGTLRTHIDSIGPQTAISWRVFAEMRTAWRDRIELQAAALFPVEFAVDDEPQFKSIVATVAKHDGIIGGLTYSGAPPDAKLDLALDRIFQAANAHGLDVDFHTDESASPNARSLEPIALAALRNKFNGQVTAGHCCSLSLQDDATRRCVIARLAEARIAVVSLPMCNMYLQDREPGRTPRWRGVAPLHELAAAGVPVMVASDNTRDPFYAYGDLDMLEVFREATRILQFDHTPQPWLHLLGPAPAAIMGLPHAGVITAGASADLVLTGARTVNELNSRPWSDRVVLVAGKAIDRTLPDYAELDDLLRM